MALFDPGVTTCSLCEQIVYEDDDLVGTSHFIGENTHPLWQYSDSTMHRRCFCAWEHRRAFVEKYIEEAWPHSVYRLRWFYLWAVVWWWQSRR